MKILRKGDRFKEQLRALIEERKDVQEYARQLVRTAQVRELGKVFVAVKRYEDQGFVLDYGEPWTDDERIRVLREVENVRRRLAEDMEVYQRAVEWEPLIAADDLVELTPDELRQFGRHA